VDAHVLVPVKRLDQAKTRLAATLSPAERADLVQELLAHVLDAAQGAGVGPVTVVSAEDLPLDGVPRFDDGGLPWNEALAAAMSEVVREPVAAVVAGDLPLLRSDEVAALVQATPGRGLAIARARDGGTNAVAMRPPAVLGTHFGEPGSAAVHEQAARTAGVDAHVIDLPGLAFDVDTPEDLDRLRKSARRASGAGACGRWA
jgi:2-phospho-L-lactate guanylyltransferase